MPDLPYKPSFKMWLFSLFIAAGFGGVAADGVKYLMIDIFKTDGKLDFVDYGCWDRKGKDNTVPTCEYIFRNVGDKPVIVTDIEIGGKRYRSFLTNNPGGFRNINHNFTSANISLTESEGLLVVTKGGVPKEDWEKEACLLHREKKLICVTPVSYE